MRLIAQSTIELLILFALATIVLFVVIAILPTQAVSGSVLHDGEIAEQTVRMVAQNCNEVYLCGEGAQKTIWIDIPQSAKISQSFIGERLGDIGKVIVINTLGEGDVITTTNAPVCGKWPTTAGRHSIKIEYNSTNPHVMVNSNC